MLVNQHLFRVKFKEDKSSILLSVPVSFDILQVKNLLIRSYSKEIEFISREDLFPILGYVEY